MKKKGNVYCKRCGKKLFVYGGGIDIKIEVKCSRCKEICCFQNGLNVD